jgi:malic enzyme
MGRYGRVDIVHFGALLHGVSVHDSGATRERRRPGGDPRPRSARTRSTTTAAGPAGQDRGRATKPASTQRDLSLAYSPGVAEPCREIARDPEEVFRYTARGNLVAVVSNGTAVLGLGDIGALASKPVMEGKAVLFKRFADIDVFDLEVGSKDPDDVIRFCELLEPTVGGINLEDIAAPSASTSRRS